MVRVPLAGAPQGGSGSGSEGASSQEMSLRVGERVRGGGS